MAVPQLMVADAAYKAYPGQVVVLRCEDWMGPARATLVAEDDARAITSRAVQETQQSTTQPFDDYAAAFSEVGDTLVIPVADLPLEPQDGFSSGMQYWLWLSLKIEGDWNPNQPKTTRGGVPDQHNKSCAIALYDSTYQTATLTNIQFNSAFYLPRNRPNYMMIGLNAFPRSGGLVGDEEIHLRAWAAPTTTIVLLLDQLFFIPWVFSGTRAGQWKAIDFARVPGSWADTVESASFVDGDDGGDVNGKFTWFPYSLDGNTPLRFTGSTDGGGDYQKDDSEYMVQVDEDTPIEIAKTSGDGSTTESPTGEQAYSVHGAQFYDTLLWVDDEFDRTTASGWGVTDEGFAWETKNVANAVADVPEITFSENGSQGVVTWSFGTPTYGGGFAYIGLGKAREGSPSTRGANVVGESLSFKGEIEISAIPATEHHMMFQLLEALDGVTSRGYSIYVDASAKTWTLVHTQAAGVPAAISSTFDISSWFGAGAALGWRIEIRRYKIRARVWDASGAEPSGWDHDDFRPIRTTIVTWVDYPYGDDPFVAILSQRTYRPHIELFMRQANGPLGMTAHVDNVEVAWDTDGTEDPADVNALMETPEGTEVGRITIPWGAWHAVHWGGRQWAKDGGNLPRYALDFSAKVWSDASARDMQRCEAPFWWFRSIHLHLVPMNWRSGDRRGAAYRVLVGAKHPE